MFTADTVLLGIGLVLGITVGALVLTVHGMRQDLARLHDRVWALEHWDDPDAVQRRP